MIDFTKLRDLIVEKKCVSSSDYDKEDPFIGIYWEDLIDIINKCDSEKWISVDEALPKEKYLVLTRVKTPVGIVHRSDYYINDYWYMCRYNQEEIVTHWTEIPSLKGGE